MYVDTWLNITEILCSDHHSSGLFVNRTFLVILTCLFTVAYVSWQGGFVDVMNGLVYCF